MSSILKEPRKLSVWDKPFEPGLNKALKPTAPITVSATEVVDEIPIPVTTQEIPIEVPAPNETPRSQRTRVKTTPASPKNPRLEWIPKLDKPQIELRPYQRDIDETLLPQKKSLNLQSGTLEIQSGLITGVPGAGLTLMLAKQALDLNSRGTSTLLFAKNDIQKFRIMQMILDHAPKEKRAELAKQIIVIAGQADLAKIQDPANKIFISSPDILNEVLVDPDPDKEESLEDREKRLGLKNKLQTALAHIDNTLVDDFDTYTGPVNSGYTAMLIEVLKSSKGKDSSKIPLLLGVSSVLSDRGELIIDDPSQKILNFEDFVSPLAWKKTLDYRELIEKNYLRNPQVVGINPLTGDDAIKFNAPDKNNLFIATGPGSVNHQLVEIYQARQRTHPGEKWRIIANNAEHANRLCRVFNAYGILANTVNHHHSGHFEPITTVPTNPEKNQITVRETDSSTRLVNLKAKTIDRKKILDDYNSGAIPILIDYEILQGVNDTNTDVIAHWNFSKSDNRLARSLGHSANTQAEPKKNQAIYWIAFDPKNRERLQFIFENGLLNLESFAPKVGSDSSEIQPIQIQANDTVALQIASSVSLSNGEKVWLERGLRPFLHQVRMQEKAKNGQDISLDDALKIVVKQFIKKVFKAYSGNNFSDEKLAQDLILGKRIAPTVFRKFIEFAKDEYAYNLEPASYRVPELTGIKTHQGLENSLKAIYPEFSSAAPQIDWLKHLDKEVLKIPDQAKPEQRTKYRIEALTNILINLFVDKHSSRPFKRLEDSHMLIQTIKTLLGKGDNPKLLAMMMLDRNQDLKSLQVQFPELFGTRNLIPFEKLKQNILTKFPEMPDLTSPEKRKDFFFKTLYKETNVDYAMLLDSSTDFFSSSQQPIVGTNIKAKIQNFLEEFYLEELVNDPRLQTHYEAEIKLLAESKFDDLAMELIYSQLIAKIWDKEENTLVVTKEASFDLKADTLVANAIPELYEDKIDLFTANLQWLELLDKQLQRLDETSSVIGIKKRIARSFKEFIAKNSALQMNLDKVFQVLLGTISLKETTNEDREIFAKYLEYLNLPRDKAKEVLPHLIKLESHEELWLDIESGIRPNILNANTEWQVCLQALASTEDLSMLIAKFIFEEHQKIIYDKNELTKMLRILAGDSEFFNNANRLESQKLIREFVQFVNQSAERLMETVSQFPILMGIQNKDELFAVIRNNLKVEELTSKKVRSNEKTLEQISLLETKVGLTLNEMAAHAQLKDPEKSYAVPLKLINDALKIENYDDVKLHSGVSLKPENSRIILTRDLFKAIWPDEYNYEKEGAKQEIINNFNGKDPNGLLTKTSFAKNKVILQLQREQDGTRQDLIEYICDYQDENWKLTRIDKVYALTEDEAKGIVLTAEWDGPWLRKLLELKNSSYGELLKTMDKFAEQQEDYKKVFNDNPKRMKYLANFYSILGGFGQVNSPADKAKNQKIFREWIRFLGLNHLDEIIAEFPKLTGVNSIEELRLVAKKQGYTIEKSSTSKVLDLLTKINLDHNSVQSWTPVSELITKYRSSLITLPDKLSTKLKLDEKDYIAVLLDRLLFEDHDFNKFRYNLSAIILKNYPEHQFSGDITFFNDSIITSVISIGADAELGKPIVVVLETVYKNGKWKTQECDQIKTFLWECLKGKTTHFPGKLVLPAQLNFKSKQPLIVDLIREFIQRNYPDIISTFNSVSRARLIMIVKAIFCQAPNNEKAALFPVLKDFISFLKTNHPELAIQEISDEELAKDFGISLGITDPVESPMQ